MDDSAGADHAQRILTALATTSQGHPEVVDRFAEALLRRLDGTAVQALDPRAAAHWLLDAFDRVQAHLPGTTTVDVKDGDSGLDGLSTGPTTIEIVTDDRPFLLATLNDELARRRFRTRSMWHAIVGVERAGNEISAVVPARHAHERVYVLHAELDPINQGEHDELQARLTELLEDVRRATDDFDAMRERLEELANELRFGAWTDTSDAASAEVADLLDWLIDGNIILLGIREYEVRNVADQPSVAVVEGSGLGLLRDEEQSRFSSPVALDRLAPGLRRQLADAPLLTVTMTNRLSTVHRRERMQYFGLTRRDENGNPIAEIRILGLFTRKALAEPVRSTPVLRAKLREILEREDVVDGSYDEIALTSLFQALPKDELFQAEVDDLHTMLVGLLHAEDANDVRTLVREDARTSTVSVVVAIPRDRYTAQLRAQIQAHLAEVFGTARIDVELSLGDRPDALARFLIHVDGELSPVPHAQLGAEIGALARSWLDDVQAAAAASLPGSPQLAALAARLPIGYREATRVDDAVSDLRLLDQLDRKGTDLVVEVRADPGSGLVRIRAAKRGAPLELSSFIPVLESMGLTVVEEVPHRLAGDGKPLVLHDFGTRAPALDPQADGARIADAIHAAWQGHLAIDGLPGARQRLVAEVRHLSLPA